MRVAIALCCLSLSSIVICAPESDWSTTNLEERLRQSKAAFEERVLQNEAIFKEQLAKLVGFDKKVDGTEPPRYDSLGSTEWNNDVQVSCPLCDANIEPKTREFLKEKVYELLRSDSIQDIQIPDSVAGDQYPFETEMEKAVGRLSLFAMQTLPKDIDAHAVADAILKLRSKVALIEQSYGKKKSRNPNPRKQFNTRPASFPALKAATPAAQKSRAPRTRPSRPLKDDIVGRYVKPLDMDKPVNLELSFKTMHPHPKQLAKDIELIRSITH